MANPASDFVANFIGTDRGKRALSLKKTESGTILVDSEGPWVPECSLAGWLTSELDHQQH
ncbi:MAG: hypothetical protein MH186_03260 [Marinobacter sp.]|nr:hypothetical protein [Marinobacter sp.]